MPSVTKTAARSGWLCLLMVALALCGCSSLNSNPPSPHRNTGYVDFYTDSNLWLSWEVKRHDASAGKLRTVYSEFEPVQGSVLRVASLPGNHSFQVWFINRYTTGPRSIDVQVADGKVTPVHITLSPQGEVFTDRKEFRFGGSSKGYARGTKMVTVTGERYRIDAAPGDPRAYATREHMPYWTLEEKK